MNTKTPELELIKRLEHLDVMLAMVQSVEHHGDRRIIEMEEMVGHCRTELDSIIISQQQPEK